MKLFYLTIICTLLPASAIYSQQKASKNELSISIPFVWQSVEEKNMYTTIGQPATVSGNALTSGINVAYNRYLIKGLFLTGGIGYNKQNFSVPRRLEHQTPNLNYPTYGSHSYNYQNIQFSAGLGYSIFLGENWSLAASATYNQYTSFKQVYYFFDDFTSVSKQTNNNTYSFGHNYVGSVGLYKKVSLKITIGLNLLLPIKTQWRKDAIFKEDPNEYYEPKSAIGMGISAKYSF